MRQYKKSAKNKEYTKAYNYNNKDKINARYNEIRKINPQKNRDAVKKHKYSITSEQFEQMLKAQDYKCKICKIETGELSKALHIDHCHKSGNIRGLLCNKCNVLLGFARDDENILLNAIEYLAKIK
jgi:hypothetical protein